MSKKRYRVWIEIEELEELEDGDVEYEDIDINFGHCKELETKEAAINFAAKLQVYAKEL